jgi:hypothetical protein
VCFSIIKRPLIFLQSCALCPVFHPFFEPPTFLLRLIPFKTFLPHVSVSSILVLFVAGAVSALFVRAFYNIFLHPLAKYPGPWYTSATSLSRAIISVLRVEPQWLLGLTKKYGSKLVSELLRFTLDYSDRLRAFNLQLVLLFESHQLCFCFPSLAS